MMRRWMTRAGDGILVVTALAGLLAVGWTVYAQHSDATIVVVETGSMTPTLPQGAAAIAVPVPAEDLRVGDVVTVRRDTATPWVTHRIAGIRPAEDAPTARSLLLQGDANDSPDPFRYDVTQALRVTHAAPHLGPVVEWIGTPLVRLGGVGLLALLMLWAFRRGTGNEAPEETKEKVRS